MRAAQGLNLTVRFLCELAAIAAVAYGAYEAADGVLGWVLAAAAALSVIAVWGLFVAPRRAIDLAHPVRFAIELAVWAAAAGALAAAGQRTPALVFAIVAVGSGILNYRWSG